MFDKIKKFLISDTGFYISAVIAICIVGFFVGDCRNSSDLKQKNYDKEHCVQYAATTNSSNDYRACICYDDEKCAMFVKEIQ